MTFSSTLVFKLALEISRGYFRKTNMYFELMRHDNIKVNTICPGWVKIDMGGDSATLTVEESTDKIIEFALNRNFPYGKFLRHGIEIPG